MTYDLGLYLPYIQYGHGGGGRSLSFIESGVLVSGGADGAVRLWQNGDCKQTMTGHLGVVWSVAVGAKDEWVSAGADGTMRLWSAIGHCSRIMRPLRPYEGMEISDAIGLTEAQRRTLLALGAVENASLAGY